MKIPIKVVMNQNASQSNYELTAKIVFETKLFVPYYVIDECNINLASRRVAYTCYRNFIDAKIGALKELEYKLMSDMSFHSEQAERISKAFEEFYKFEEDGYTYDFSIEHL